MSYLGNVPRVRRSRFPAVFLVGAFVARTGEETSGPALLLAGAALTGSVTEGSSLLAGVTVAAVAGGPVTGALLDRSRRPGRMLAVALAVHALGLGAVLLALGRLPFAAVLPIAVCTGLTGPALSGGWTARLPETTSPDRLHRASTYDAMTIGAAGLAGPALAGGTAEVWGAPAALVVAAALVGSALPAAWALPARAGGGGRVRASSLRGDLAAGAKAVLRTPALARATLTSTLSCAAQGMLAACAVPLGERVLGGAGRGAMLLACSAIAALAANAVLARHPRPLAPDTIVWAAALVQAAALTLAAWAPPALLLGAVLLAGVGEGPQLAAVFAIRHRESPPRLRGQIFTTGAGAKLTAYALGVAVAGPAASRSLPGTLLLAASVSVVAALCFFMVPSPAPFPTPDRTANRPRP